MKNIMLVHGFNGIPKIYGYLETELEKKGYNVIIPEFPTKADITIEKYFDVFDKYKDYFNENLIVVAHSLGNAMLVKYLCKNNLGITGYISLAGFGETFNTEGRDDLNTAIKAITLTNDERQKIRTLIQKRYSIYSNDDHIVPYKLLEDYPNIINSEAILITNIGHMGKKSGLEKLPEVVKIIEGMNS